MSTAVATLDLPAISKYGPEDDNQDDFTKGANFLPRLEFKSAGATIVKQKKFPCDHYAMVVGKKELVDLGETFVAFPLAYRYKALDFREKGKVKVSYDPKSEEFLKIKTEADRQRPPGEMSGCMYGAEFLLAIEKDGKTELVTLLCGSASWKAAAKKLFGLTRQFVTFGSKLIEGKYTYMAPEISTASGSFDFTEPAKINKAVALFIAATGTVTEKDEEGDENPPATTAEAGRVR